MLASVLVVPTKLVSPPKKSTSQNGVRSIFSDDGVAPVAPVYDGVAPAPVEDTPEVVAARAEHLAAFEKIAAEHRYI